MTFANFLHTGELVATENAQNGEDQQLKFC